MNPDQEQSDLGPYCLHYRLPTGNRAFSSNFGKRPHAKIGKKDRLNIKIYQINNIEHYKGSKIYPQNQVILDYIMPSIPLKY